MRVPDPMPLDFAALADGVIRNNLGVAAIRVECEVRIEGSRLVVEPTGQGFAVDGEPPAAGRSRFTVLAWDDPERTALRVLP